LSNTEMVGGDRVFGSGIYFILLYLISMGPTCLGAGIE